MHLFFADEISGEYAKLGAEESHHAQKVLRLKEGDNILATVGRGVIYKAEIVNPSVMESESAITLSRAELLLKILAVHSEESAKNYLHIAIAPTKSLDRFEFFLEKATEAGVNEITPLIGFHSERKIYKTERGKKIIKAAAKQSLSHWLPVLNEPVSTREFLKQERKGSLFIAHCDDNSERRDILTKLSQYPETTILIGPEGDFSQEEINLAIENNYTPVSLGHKRLRTETAGIVVAIATKLI